MKKLIPLLFLTLLFGGAYSQCMLVPVSLTERVSNSTAIVEGEVVSQKSYWNTAHNNIYTLNRIRPVKIFNWNSSASHSQDFYVVTLGGVVGTTMLKVTSTLQLKVGEVGVFFGKPSSISVNASDANSQFLQFDPVAGPQGFIHFDENKQFGHDAFNTFTVMPDLYNKLEAATGKKMIVIGGYEEDVPTTNMAPTVTSFSPDSLSAGTKSVVTIKGTNFGSTQGSSRVRFRDANNGGSTLYDPEAVEYVSWTDTEIKVEVPRRAGTGKFTVDNGSGTVQSSNNLVITFAQLNVVDQNKDVFQPQHIGENGTGYTWQFYTAFDANASAKQSFLRAFQNWRCGTLINWDIGATSTVNTIARDGTNVIRFDIGSELPNGVLGRCSSWWSGCFVGGTTLWYVAELDIVFDDGQNWNYGPGSPTNSQYDFESVAVHELGHGHQLGHVIKSSEIMHYSISNGQTKRVLSSEGDLSGGDYVMDLNLKGGICGRSVMVALNPNFCSLIPVAGFSASASTLCPTQSVTFTDTSAGSTNSFTWDFGANATPATAMGKGPHIVSYSASGKKTVKLTVGGVIGNDVVEKKDLITVDPDKPVSPSTILGPDTACVGSQRYEINKVADATAYEWGVNGGGSVNKTTDSFAMVSFSAIANTADVWVKAMNSCGTSDSIIKTVPVLDMPVSDFTFNIQGDTILLAETSQDAYATLWKFPDGQTSSDASLNFIPAQSGLYNVKLLATNFCGTDSVTKSINFIKVSINELVNKVGLSIYPNPFSNTATIKFDNTHHSMLSFEIYDLLGKKVMSYALVKNETTINRDYLESGVYIFKAKAGGEVVATGRLSVQ